MTCRDPGTPPEELGLGGHSLWTERRKTTLKSSKQDSSLCDRGGSGGERSAVIPALGQGKVD